MLLLMMMMMNITTESTVTGEKENEQEWAEKKNTGTS